MAKKATEPQRRKHSTRYKGVGVAEGKVSVVTIEFEDPLAKDFRTSGDLVFSSKKGYTEIRAAIDRAARDAILGVKPDKKHEFCNTKRLIWCAAGLLQQYLGVQLSDEPWNNCGFTGHYHVLFSRNSFPVSLLDATAE